MAEWVEKSLGEVTSYIAKGIPPQYTDKYSENVIYVLNQKCNRDYSVSYEQARLHDLSKKKIAEEKMLKSGDVLINSTGEGTAGRVAQLWNIPSQTTVDGHMIILRPTSEVDTLYYGYAIKAQQFMIESLAEGSTGQTEINRKRLQEEITISYPKDKKKQHSIAKILEEIDKKIEVNNQINRNLSEQAQAVFKEWFVDNPESAKWKQGTFSDLVISTLGGDWGKEEKEGNYTEQVYCVRGADIPEVKEGNKGKMPTRFILPKNYAAKQLVAGDIVVEISGGSPTQSTGRVASISQSLLDRYDKGMVCTNFCRAIKPKEGYSMFIYYYWQYLYERGIFFLYENGTTGIKNLDIKGFLENEEIIIPPKDLVDKFDALCQTIFNEIFKNGISTEKLAETRDTLLPRLMSRKLDVSELEL